MSGLIDAHVHVWDPTRLDYPWLDGLDALQRRFLPAEVDRGDGLTTRMVFVQAGCTPEQALDEVRWVTGFGTDWPELAGIVADADLRSPDLDASLDALLEAGPVVGIRHLLQGEPIAALDDPALRAGLAKVAERGLTFDACITHPQLPALRRLLGAVDGLSVVLDHLGKPPVDDGIASEAGRAWADEISALAAELPLVHVKLSGLPAEASDTASLDRNAGALLSHALDAFGPDRAMLGSDWPVSARFGAGGRFSAWVDRVRAAVGDDAGDLAAVEHGTAERFYGLASTAEHR